MLAFVKGVEAVLNYMLEAKDVKGLNSALNHMLEVKGCETGLSRQRSSSPERSEFRSREDSSSSTD